MDNRPMSGTPEQVVKAAPLTYAASYPQSDKIRPTRPLKAPGAITVFVFIRDLKTDPG